MKKSEIKKIIKMLHKFQDDIYWGKGEIKIDLIGKKFKDQNQKERNDQRLYEFGVVRGLEEFKNLLRRKAGLKEKCSWRDYYSDMDWDFDTGCGRFRLRGEPEGYCEYCGREIE